MPCSTRRLRLVLLVTAAFLVHGAAAPAAPDLFDEIFARARPLQARLQNLRAKFTETTVSSLLAKPGVAKGTLLAATPPRLLLRYGSPEPKVVALAGNKLVVSWPARGEREELDVTDTMKRVNQYFANADASGLRRIFTITASADPEVDKTYRVDMVPKRKQMREGLERLQLWLRQDSLMLVQMRMTFPGGDSNTFRIEDAEMNVPLDVKAFDVDVPPARRK